LATNEIAQTGLSSLPPVIYYSEQLFSMHISQSNNRIDAVAVLKAIPQELDRVPLRFVVQSVALIAPYGLESN
ncbi:hypothetical protein ACK3Z1_18755, partial [Aeromonas caviae]